MRVKAVCLSALVALSWASLAAAGPIVEAAERAETLQAEGKAVEALDALNEAIDSVWREAPLAFRRVVLVESAEGFGQFQERSDRVFRPDEEIRVYVEPVGYGYGASGDAASIDFNVDLAIENTTGQVLGEAENVFEFSTETYPDRREFGMTLIVQAPYVRPGDYKAIFTVRDGNSDKSGTFEVPFTVAPPVFEDTGAQASGGEAAPAPAGASATQTEPAAQTDAPGTPGSGGEAPRQ